MVLVAGHLCVLLGKVEGGFWWEITGILGLRLVAGLFGSDRAEGHFSEVMLQFQVI